MVCVLLLLLYSHAGKEHLLEVATPQRIFYIQGDNEEQMFDWIKAFQVVINIKRTATVSINND